MRSDDSGMSADKSDAVDRILSEGALGMSAAARLLGTFREGRPTHPSTVARWHRDGVTLADGRVIRLEAIRVNGRLVTSRGAIVRFIAAQQTQQIADVAARPDASTKRNGGTIADDQLREMGC